MRSSEDEKATLISKKYKRRAKKSKPSPNVTNSAQRVLFPSPAVSENEQVSPARNEEAVENQQVNLERETVEVNDWEDEAENEGEEQNNDQFQQEQVAEENNQGDSAVENNQQNNANIQQDEPIQQENVNVQQDENVQDKAAEEEIQQDNVAEEQVAEEEFQQEPLDVEPLAKGNDEVCIPEEDLINLSEDIAKFNSWRRIRNLSILDFNAAVNEDSERLQELELWALEFSKDLPAEESFREINLQVCQET